VPHVIFTTAYDEFAVKGFELNALDYLLKPVDPARLAAAINRLPGLKQSALAKVAPGRPSGRHRQGLREGGRAVLVRRGEPDPAP
jgi:two-component system LytT family response regulator